MIRFAKEADLPAVLEIYGPYVKNTAVSFEYTVPTLEEFTARFRAVTVQFPWLVWEGEGRVLGYCYACAPFDRAAFSWCAEPSVYLAPEAHRRGIGKALYLALEKLLTIQGYQVLYAIVTTDNAPSIAFHQALGYYPLASFPDCGFKQGAWHGITWLEKRLNPVEVPTASPKSIRHFVKADQNLPFFLDRIALS